MLLGQAKGDEAATGLAEARKYAGRNPCDLLRRADRLPGEGLQEGANSRNS